MDADNDEGMEEIQSRRPQRFKDLQTIMEFASNIRILQGCKILGGE